MVRRRNLRSSHALVSESYLARVFGLLRILELPAREKREQKTKMNHLYPFPSGGANTRL